MVKLESAGKMDSDTVSRNALDALRGASVVLLRRDAVLMVERGRGLLAGYWSFPGGRVEPGEDIETTARRELFEETGLTAGAFVRLGVFRPAPDLSPLELTVFAGRAGDGAPVAGDDALRAEFVPFHAVLLRGATPGAPGWIARALAALSRPPMP
jgi:8-oxo-dGTP pyrophosphatase MutT (NUDIX family)